MAVYKKLLLSAGGGIISARQQAEQIENTATILIGLGGTGIDCLRTIKTQVYARLKPDDLKDAVPKYEHIRFLGVDTDEKSKQDSGSNGNIKADSIMTLGSTEFFSIANQDVRLALKNAKALEKRPELGWLRWEDIPAPNLGKAGAGGIRQVGRFMMMDRSQSFINKLEQEIEKAKRELDEPAVNIHIFSGLSGGTGAGSFLDVCYMIKDIAKNVNSVTTYGYFFLPDVNLSKIPHNETATRTYIQQNGYAAMQELDYCMQLQFNGGGFVQEYEGGRKIEWKEQPVDMCHLICATDQNGKSISNPYEYAMNVAAEYLMDFLTKPTDIDRFGMEQQLSNFILKINTTNSGKTIGSTLAYCIIGASCAVVPLREINTYLVSECFQRFSGIIGRVPERRDVEQFAIDAFAKGARNLDDIYESLYNMILEGSSIEYDAYQDDWTFVRDYENGEFELHFTDQRSNKDGQIETNAKSMLDTGNEDSLIGLVKKQLLAVMTDLGRGPVFAQNLLSGSRKNNFLNIIDGLIEKNNKKYEAEKMQETLRERECDQAEEAFEKKCANKIFNNAVNEFADYEHYRMLLEQHRLLLDIYEKLDMVLTDFRIQIAEVESSYYMKFSRVMDTLVETFRQNKNALLNDTVLRADNMFAKTMMTVSELKPSLDKRIDQIDPEGLFDLFIRRFVQNEDKWIGEDEDKITRLLTDFFTKDVFHDFAGRSITEFLEDKYGIYNNDALLSNKIYEKWMKPLTRDAIPLFYFDQSIWKKSKCSALASLSVPEISKPIKDAAKMMYEEDDMWKVNESALTDRIYVMHSACALPLCSYNYCNKYEQMYSASTMAGHHYYEGKPIEGMKFDDWRELPSIIPQSLAEPDKMPEKMRKIMLRGQMLYERAEKRQVFNDKNEICRPDAEGLATLSRITEQCRKLSENLSNPAQIENAEAFSINLKQAMEIVMHPTGYKMPDEITKDTSKDYFVSSPAYYGIVEDILADMDKVMQEAEMAGKDLEEKIIKIKVGGRERKDYFDALFTGVITHEARTVSYKNEETFEEITLCKRGEEFPFDSIPPYQGYVSYGKLPEATKAEIKKAVDQCFTDESKLKAESVRLQEIFTGKRFEGWEEIAENFPEKNDILALLRKMKQEFSAHCKTL